MMKEIFSAANFVIAWLGSQTEESAQILDEIRQIANRSHIETRQHMTQIEARNGARKLFFDRLYWKRMWIVQEFLLAPDIYLLCGPQGVWWNEFKDYLHSLEQAWTLGSLRVSPAAAALYYQRTERKHSSRVFSAATLDLMIEKFHSGRCVDVRDRVFALLGLVNVSDASSAVLLADYTITPTQLYYRTLSYVRNSTRLRESTMWARFRGILASALDISLNDCYYHADLIYQAAEEDRPLSKPILRLHPDSREILGTRFLAFLRENLSKGLEMEGVDSWGLYHQVIAYFDSFPRQEDPDAWQCFESLLKEALKIAPLNDPDMFTAYVEFPDPD
jgi:hypothetical protein